MFKQEFLDEGLFDLENRNNLDILHFDVNEILVNFELINELLDFSDEFFVIELLQIVEFGEVVDFKDGVIDSPMRSVKVQLGLQLVPGVLYNLLQIPEPLISLLQQLFELRNIVDFQVFVLFILLI